MIRRDHGAIDGFGQGKIETVIHTSLSILRQLIGGGKELLIRMMLEREVFQLLPHG